MYIPISYSEAHTSILLAKIKMEMGDKSLPDTKCMEHSARHIIGSDLSGNLS
jgi:hypothetical protein